MRGVSAMRGTGLRKRQTLSVKIENLAVPALREKEPIDVDPDHGLWEFFNFDRTTLTQPDVMAEHGRPWTYNELKGKNWEDLHSLWWICLKERSRIATEKAERKRTAIKTKRHVFGDVEAGERDYRVRGPMVRFTYIRQSLTSTQVRATMTSIRNVLTRRWYAWEDARTIVAEGRDPEVTFNQENDQFEYTPQVMDPYEVSNS